MLFGLSIAVRNLILGKMLSWSRIFPRLYNSVSRKRSLINSSLFSTSHRTHPKQSVDFRDKHKTVALLILNSSIIPVLGFKMSDKAAEFKGVHLQTISEADKLFDDAKYDELLQLLEEQPNWDSNEQILWRLARCKFQLAKSVKDQKDKYEQLLDDAHALVKKSLELDGKNGLAHKWAAILLDAVSTLKGTKERVLQVLNVREHMEKAVEYAPEDATSYYLLGEWHYSCYQVSWWERKIANIAFGKLPDADMEVALKMFEKAEEVEKDFYSKNKLMLAKTLLELKRDKARALELLKEVVAKYSSSEKWDDKEACEEASKLVNQYK